MHVNKKSENHKTQFEVTAAISKQEHLIWAADLEEILIHCIRCVLCPFSTAGLTNVNSFNITFREAVRACHKKWQWEKYPSRGFTTPGKKSP